MALDVPTPTLDAVTRACYARGLASETWLALVRQAAEAAQLDHVELERQLSAALVALLASGTAAPTAPAPPLVAAYLSVALDARVCGPAAVARAVCAPPSSSSTSSSATPLSLAATEATLRAILLSLDSPPAPPPALTAPAPAPPPLLDPTTPLPSALLPLLDTLVPLLLAAHPRRAPCTAAYLARVLRGAAQAAEREGEGEGEAERELLAKRVRRARASLEGLDEAREVGAALSALEERLAPGGGGAGPGAVAALGERARGASGRGRW
ncbi:uncharacterized protein RHOBADRAFT_45358 [Rhodotorula graminis WP1]|uniref:Uncharacterized protein n=1 Tax=Rhodotorula graminis (strain WP1) TaxID=578459 RepID=A0A0P9GKV4_RHOGW|nr:uncharacterized protein RHOBADRAFT_45358 [Rhodotorula graminis WP1]KPV74062.1 hypothetical protein RHOBADRAFT_45358 [Rhodotorula graminis WP1]